MSGVDVTQSVRDPAISQVAATDKVLAPRPVPERPVIMGDAALSSTFDGVDPTATGVKMYIQSVEARAERMGGNLDKLRRVIFYNGLRGIAMRWFQVQPGRIQDDWILLKETFEEDFSTGASGDRTEALLHRGLSSLRQGTMSLLDYVGEADKLASLINETDKDMARKLAHTFVNGIKKGYAQWAMAVLLTGEYDFAQARDAALKIYYSKKDSSNTIFSGIAARVQTAEASSQDPSPAKISPKRSQTLVAPGRPDADRGTPLTQAYADRLKREADITCYNCLETGHYSSNCPSARVSLDQLVVNMEKARRRYNREKNRATRQEATSRQAAQSQARRAFPKILLEDPVQSATGLRRTGLLGGSRVEACSTSLDHPGSEAPKGKTPLSLQTQPSGQPIGRPSGAGQRIEGTPSDQRQNGKAEQQRGLKGWQPAPAPVQVQDREKLYRPPPLVNGKKYCGRDSAIPGASVGELSDISPLFLSGSSQSSSSSSEGGADNTAGSKTEAEIPKCLPVTAWVGSQLLHRTFIDSHLPANLISFSTVQMLGLVPRLHEQRPLAIRLENGELEIKKCVDIKVNVAGVWLDVVAYVADIGVPYDLILAKQYMKSKPKRTIEGRGGKGGKSLLVRRVKPRVSHSSQTSCSSDSSGSSQPAVAVRKDPRSS